MSWPGKANSDIAKTIGIMLWQCEVTVFTQAGFRVRRFCCLLQLFPNVIRIQIRVIVNIVMHSVCQRLKKSKLGHASRLCCFLLAFCDLIRAFLLGYSDTFSSGNYRHHSVIVMSQTVPC